MLKIIPRPASEWNPYDLIVYNIFVESQDELEFFSESTNEVDLSDVPEGVCNLLVPSKDDEESYAFLKYMEIVLHLSTFENSALVDFTFELLKVLKYNKLGYIIGKQVNIPLLNCGEYTDSTAHVCVIHDEQIKFISIVDINIMNFDLFEPQIIGLAISAFQYNNSVRANLLGLNPLTEHTFPCLIFFSLYPIFYKVKITKELSDCVINGKNPNFKTKVLRCSSLAFQFLSKEGIRPIHKRQYLFKCFKIFKKLVFE